MIKVDLIPSMGFQVPRIIPTMPIAQFNLSFVVGRNSRHGFGGFGCIWIVTTKQGQTEMLKEMVVQWLKIFEPCFGDLAECGETKKMKKN